MVFREKIALVTGGGSGIGRATALALARAGAAVLIGNRNKERGETVVREIRDLGGTGEFHSTDVSNVADVKALVDYAVSRFGKLDLAFNNSGVDGEQKPLHEQDESKANFLIDVNVKGVFWSMKYGGRRTPMYQGAGCTVMLVRFAMCCRETSSTSPSSV